MSALLALVALAAADPIPAGPQHARVPGTSIAFVHSRFVEVANPTSLAFGPDGRLYVSRIDGQIVSWRVERLGPGWYTASNLETIDLLQDIPNRDDDGTPRPDLRARLVTGIVAAGTADRPVIYATSSDPRMGDKGGTDLGIDTRSGAVSRLSWDGEAWRREELVTGLPRSREDHAPHGVALRGDALYFTQGGNTNMGAPSSSFSGLAEMPLSGAILRLELSEVGTGPTVYASGFRNAYDLAFTSDGTLYTVDNGPNRTWSGPPSDCTDRMVPGGANFPDTLHRVVQGTYGGHPNPSRGECTFVPPAERPSVLAVFPGSTNGIAEYTSSAFDGALEGGLLTVSFDGNLWWLPPGLPPAWFWATPPDGPEDVGAIALTNSAGVWPLDVIALGDDSPFPGTLWIAAHATGRIQVMEPLGRP